MRTLCVILIIMFALAYDAAPPSDRRYIPIAQVDTRVYNDKPYLFYIVTYDSEEDIAEACGSWASNFTKRGCVVGIRGLDGGNYYRIMVLSHDYIALRHELNHIIHGPCHIYFQGETPLKCQEWLVKHKLKPIGSQKITIGIVDDPVQQ